MLHFVHFQIVQFQSAPTLESIAIAIAIPLDSKVKRTNHFWKTRNRLAQTVYPDGFGWHGSHSASPK